MWHADLDRRSLTSSKRDALRVALVRNKGLRVYILVDALRGTRPDPDYVSNPSTSVSLLVTLVERFGPERVQIRLYHTPNLRGLWRYIVPKRLNEGFGLQHIKLCAFDDELIVTGANLSHEYFENRQDRYFVVKSEELTTYCCSLVFVLGSFSYLLLPSSFGLSSHDPCKNYCIEWPKTNALPRPLEKTTLPEIHEAARSYIIPLIWKQRSSLPSSNSNCGSVQNHGSDTVIYPLTQLTPLFGSSILYTGLDIRRTSTHEWAILRILSLLHESQSWTLATPYLRLPKSLVRVLTGRPKMLCKNSALLNGELTIGKIIMAAPEAMSFHGARGLAGYIPIAFQKGAQRLLSTIEGQTSPASGPCDPARLRLLQWQRGVAHRASGWTFHAKGWWIRGVGSASTKKPTPSGDDITMTLVGSSNYGERSFTLDLEMDVLIVTSNEDLKERIHDEEGRIMTCSIPVKRQTLWEIGMIDGVLVSILMLVIWTTGLSI